MQYTHQINFDGNKYLVAADIGYPFRETVFTESPDIQIPEILESYLEYRCTLETDS